MSSSYHPQTDGQTERLNQCMETYLRCMTQAAPQKWSKWISLAEFWYNTTFHSALGKSPFEVLYGYKPKHFGIQDLSLQDSTTIPDLQTWFKDKDDMQRLIQQNLLRAQQRMKSQADKKRVERQFAVGDQVYLKLQPYVQTSLGNRSNQKLSYKYFGPYGILKRVGEVAYKLQLPADTKIHLVVHVSLLKQALPGNEVVQHDLPSQVSVMEGVSTPLQVIDTKTIDSGKKLVRLVQVQWSGLPSSWATWENEHRLRHEFPNAPAWGQAGLQGGRMSRRLPI
jgi:ribosomal protein L21E